MADVEQVLNEAREDRREAEKDPDDVGQEEQSSAQAQKKAEHQTS